MCWGSGNSKRNCVEGPTKDRGCTDVFCCILFLVFTTAMIGVSAYAYTNGDPDILTKAYDPDHQACGGGDLASYPYIYFASMDTDCLWRTVCVKECPTADSTTLECSVNSVVTSCDENISTDCTEQTLIYASTSYFDVVCIPDSDDYIEIISSALSFDEYESYVSDLENTWMIIIGSGVLALIFSFIFLCLIKISAGCVVWSFFLLIISSFFILGGFYVQEYVDLVGGDYESAWTDLSTTDFSSYETDPRWSLAIGCTALIFGLLSLILLCCLGRRLSIAIAVLKCSASFVMENGSIICVPVFFFIFVVIFLAMWCFTAIYLYSVGTLSEEEFQLPFAQIIHSDDITYMGYFHFFGLLWWVAFLMGASSFIIIGTVCYWYFSSDRTVEQQKESTSSNVIQSVKTFLSYHIGTVAFGSLLIAIIQTIRIIFEYMAKTAKGVDQNSTAKCLISCLRCCLWCFEKCVKFINKSAYVQTVMFSLSYCPAAGDAIELMISNPVKVALVAGLGCVFELLGTLAIALSSTVTCYLVITTTEYYTSILNSPVVPTVCFFLLGLSVGDYFMNLFGTSADTIIVLYLMEEQCAKYVPGASKHTPQELRKFIQEYDTNTTDN